MKTCTVKSVPQWAVTYLVYGDETGLDREDVEQASKWVASALDEELRLIDVIEGSENEFCRDPQFGPPCATVDFIAAKVTPRKYPTAKGTTK